MPKKAKIIFNRSLMIILAASIILLLVAKPAGAALYMGSKAYCLMDLTTGQVLCGHNIHESRPVASTTKIMTAILTLEYTRKDEVVVISPVAASTPESAIGLKSGQEMRVEDLLKAALIRSANDASVALAEYVAGSEDLFAYLMNKKAFILGAANTHFCNASGLPNEKHRSTSFDLALITCYAMSNKDLAELVATREATINHPGYPAGKTIKNTNRLLTTYEGAIGVKTGTTDAAGKCLIGAARRGNRTLVSVVLHSWDRYADSTRLLNYGFNAFSWQQVVDKTNFIKHLSVKNGKQLKVEIYPQKDVYMWLPGEEVNLEKIVKLNYRPQAPLAKGEKVGQMEIRHLGTTVARVNLVTGHQVEKEPQGLARILYRFYLQMEKEIRER